MPQHLFMVRFAPVGSQKGVGRPGMDFASIPIFLDDPLLSCHNFNSYEN